MWVSIPPHRVTAYTPNPNHSCKAVCHSNKLRASEYSAIERGMCQAEVTCSQGCLQRWPNDAVTEVGFPKGRKRAWGKASTPSKATPPQRQTKHRLGDDGRHQLGNDEHATPEMRKEPKALFKTMEIKPLLTDFVTPDLHTRHPCPWHSSPPT
jgi:hypothetical protein